MTGDEQTTGSITSSDMVKRKLAEESKKWNLTENTRFGAVFPELKIQNAKDIAAAEAEKQQKELMQKEKESESVAPLEMEALDAEDRARLLVHQEQPIDGGLLLTLVGMLVAAVLAVYMYF